MNLFSFLSFAVLSTTWVAFSDVMAASSEKTFPETKTTGHIGVCSVSSKDSFFFAHRDVLKPESCQHIGSPNVIFISMLLATSIIFMTVLDVSSRFDEAIHTRHDTYVVVTTIPFERIFDPNNSSLYNLLIDLFYFIEKMLCGMIYIFIPVFLLLTWLYFTILKIRDPELPFVAWETYHFYSAGIMIATTLTMHYLMNGTYFKHREYWFSVLAVTTCTLLIDNFPPALESQPYERAVPTAQERAQSQILQSHYYRIKIFFTAMVLGSIIGDWIKDDFCSTTPNRQKFQKFVSDIAGKSLTCIPVRYY